MHQIGAIAFCNTPKAPAASRTSIQLPSTINIYTMATSKQVSTIPQNNIHPHSALTKYFTAGVGRI